MPEPQSWNLFQSGAQSTNLWNSSPKQTLYMFLTPF